jgi:hypothetical protein
METLIVPLRKPENPKKIMAVKSQKFQNYLHVNLKNSNHFRAIPFLKLIYSKGKHHTQTKIPFIFVESNGIIQFKKFPTVSENANQLYVHNHKQLYTYSITAGI